MAVSYDADLYRDARPTYPSDWYSMLAARTPCHSLAWDVGTGNGQAAIGIAEHYAQVIATDVSKTQIERAIPHPKVRYIHTPLSLEEEELVSLIGGEGSVDLVTVATAVHWFDLPSFYSVVNRILRRPGGLLAVWGYNGSISIDPTFDSLLERFKITTRPFWNPNVHYVADGYRTLPFPFEGVGLGSEGEPVSLEMHTESSFDGFVGMLRSWSAVKAAKEQGVDLLSEDVVKDFESAWGASDLIRRVTYEVFMLVGTPKSQSEFFPRARIRSSTGQGLLAAVGFHKQPALLTGSNRSSPAQFRASILVLEIQIFLQALHAAEHLILPSRRDLDLRVSVSGLQETLDSSYTNWG
ncbi:hypothetical protein MRB53_014991 [Persea americana]|uniref:Uncharacterized protein n=1 Tax=Persea americana TaxID=3435 RepID=A0ACC2KCW6_PERAE|nr:hypothetical protein MRB53_014991 [Persea americana]